jgi:hypothetical protein
VRDASSQYDCHVCGEGVLAHARLCRHCGASLLGEVVVSRAVDPRTAYAAAKALSEARGVPFGPLRDGLTKAGVVLGELSRGDAADVTLLLGTLGVNTVFRTAPVSMSKHGKAGGDRRRPSRGVFLAGGAALVAALGAAGFFATRPEPPVVATPNNSNPMPGIMAREDAHTTTLDGPGVATRAVPAVVTVHCNKASGTGFYVTPSVVLTSRRVSCGGNVTVQLANGTELPGQVEWLAATVDAATIRTSPVDIEPLWLADATEARAGHTVYSIGSPGGMASTLTRGRVAHAARDLEGVSYIQLDQAVNVGDTGAPLLNERGGVIGIVLMGLPDADGIGFALPINYVFPGPFGTFPAAWDATAWASRVGGPAPQPAEPAEPADAPTTPPPAGGLSLLVVGPVTEVMPARWQRGFPTDSAPHALVAMTADDGQPSVLSFHLQDGNGERVCSFVGTPAWRAASAVESHHLDSFVRRSRIPRSPLSLGLVSLQSPTPCAAWGAGTTLEVVGGAEGSNTVPVRR